MTLSGSRISVLSARVRCLTAGPTELYTGSSLLGHQEKEPEGQLDPG